MQKIATAILLFCSVTSAFAASKVQIAHIKEQGQDMIFIPMNSKFGARSTKDQYLIVDALESCARNARLAGGVAVLWESNERTYSIGPKPWQIFLKSIDMNYVKRRVNKELTCN